MISFYNNNVTAYLKCAESNSGNRYRRQITKNCDQTEFFFSNRKVPIWNNLPIETTNVTNVNLFNNNYDKFKNTSAMVSFVIILRRTLRFLTEKKKSVLETLFKTDIKSDKKSLLLSLFKTIKRREIFLQNGLTLVPCSAFLGFI
ncbi:hypothetical protein BpHYR1_049785 [Brachionus plicatilis]|uniref:Uncharacterized protein n=1 Tax=Brachionus plicatilis TaxID=10195 RepID=A0A3M7S8N4_BRAPC|nr:hypothetical protein BpHYR1_049785 [Brachionus plicatilis]